MQLNKINIDSLYVEESIKFYFWLNIYGICEIPKIKPPGIFDDYNFISSPNQNGFKLLNDEKEMMQLLLPKVQN